MNYYQEEIRLQKAQSHLYFNSNSGRVAAT